MVKVHAESGIDDTCFVVSVQKAAVSGSHSLYTLSIWHVQCPVDVIPQNGLPDGGAYQTMLNKTTLPVTVSSVHTEGYCSTIFPTCRKIWSKQRTSLSWLWWLTLVPAVSLSTVRKVSKMLCSVKTMIFLQIPMRELTQLISPLLSLKMVRCIFWCDWLLKCVITAGQYIVILFVPVIVLILPIIFTLVLFCLPSKRFKRCSWWVCYSLAHSNVLRAHTHKLSLSLSLSLTFLVIL